MKTETGQGRSAVKQRWDLYQINGDSADGELMELHLRALGIDPTLVTHLMLRLHKGGTFSLHVRLRHPATMSDYEWTEFKESIGENPYEIGEYYEHEHALPGKVATIPIPAELAQKLILAACCYACPDWFDAAGKLTFPR